MYRDHEAALGAKGHVLHSGEREMPSLIDLRVGNDLHFVNVPVAHRVVALQGPVLERRDDEVVARVDNNRHAADIWTCACACVVPNCGVRQTENSFEAQQGEGKGDEGYPS